MKTPHINRRKEQRPKKGKGWCVCDFALVSNDKKCPVCGRINGRTTRYKKSPPEIEEFLGV